MKVTIDRSAMNALKVEAREKAAAKGAQSAVKKVRAAIISTGRVDTGRMVSQVRSRKSARSTAERTLYSVRSEVEYADWQNDGIGPVHARPGSVLVFTPKGGTVIFRPRTRGFSGARFYEKALASLNAADFTE